MANTRDRRDIRTDERVASLRKLWADGYSAPAIANELGAGLTRCAVIGKVNRLGLSGRAKGRRARPAQTVVRQKPEPKPSRATLGVGPAVQKINRAAAPAPAAPAIKSEPLVCRAATDVVPLKLTINDLQAGDCRFIYGDPSAATYCGHPTVGNTSWCRYHAAKVFTVDGLAKVYEKIAASKRKEAA